MKTTEETTHAVETAANEILGSIKSLILDKVERKIDDEDGEYYWTKKSNLLSSVIDDCEVRLNQVAGLYRQARLANYNPKYKHYSRLVAHVRMDFLPKSLTEMLTELKDQADE